MHIFWIIFIFTFGACIGSFLNVVIYRMPRGESIVFPASHCTRCGKAIKGYDNIPLISWLILRGKCRFCKTSISPRYFIIELATALMVVGLYVCYYILKLRDGAGQFEQSWPMFAAHAMLLCVLLACSLVDIEHWMVPLEICWFVSAVGIISATARPHEWVNVSQAGPSATTGAMVIAAGVGLVLSAIAVRKGLILPSFIDDDGKDFTEKVSASKATPAKKKSDDKSRRKKRRNKSKPKRKEKKVRVAALAGKDKVNPRIEVLREVVYLAPAVVLAVLAGILVTQISAFGQWWQGLHDHGAGRLVSFEAALLGYLVGGLFIWGIRIVGTLGFNKEAMGLGDIHILAAVGAVAGWAVVSVTFFLAPFIALIWAFYLLFRSNQRELPYGPWLAVATVIVLLMYDPVMRLLEPQIAVLRTIF